MKLAVCGLDDIAKFKNCGFTNMISIADTELNIEGIRLPEITKDSHLILRFSDVHDEKHKDAPKKENLESLFQWLKLKSPNNLLIHCRAGIGRSPAIALLSLCFLNSSTTPSKHMKTVIKSCVSELVMPNILVTQIGDDLLSGNGKILNTVEIWRDEQGDPFKTK